MDLKELYRDVILDHNKRPRNFGRLDPADAQADGHNPLCGDRLSVFVKMDGDRIEDLRFEGKGCAISTASASLMTEAVKGKDKAADRRAVRKGALPPDTTGCPGRHRAGQARGAPGSARVPVTGEVREPVLAHLECRARSGREHRLHGVVE